MKLENKEKEEWEREQRRRKKVDLAIYMFEAIRRLAYQVSFFHVMMMLSLFSAFIFNS